ncbi:MAG TPA: hypothetical protein VGC76_10510 [Pyrinomonadaceae bacterium]|jgi:hypothetical protein
MKIIIPAILFCLSISTAFGQKIITSPTETSQTISIPNVATISDIEWRVLTDALRTENWDKSAFYASGLLNRLKADNEQKQIAQLRYFYLFSLAGKIHKARDAGKKTEEDEDWRELDKAVASLIGKEFVLPPREYRANCEKSLNFICDVKDNEKAFRTTATNQEGTAINSFDYVVFDKKPELKEFIDKQIFLGGTLKKVEFNDALSNEQPWIMYLIFEKGFVRVVVND